METIANLKLEIMVTSFPKLLFIDSVGVGDVFSVWFPKQVLLN